MTNISLLYDKKVKCPVCNNSFNSKKVRISKLRLLKRDEDFLSYYKDINPLLYNIFVCPNCGYAAREERFNKISFRDREKVLERVSKRWNKRSYGTIRSMKEAIETYKLALYIGEILNYKNLELANLCLNIAWLYRMGENKEEYRFLNLSKNLFEKAYSKESMIGYNMDELKLAYLIGELNRRLGNKSEAIKWFNTCISNPELKSNKALENLVREQWRLTREMT